MSEDEGDAEDVPEVVVDDVKNEAARKAREDRQEKLRKMMEDDGRSKRVTFYTKLLNLDQMRTCPTPLQKPNLRPRLLRPVT
jgi:hypothetical protein